MLYVIALFVALVTGIFFYYAGNVTPGSYISGFDRAGVLLGYLMSILAIGGGVAAYIKRGELLERLAERLKRPSYKNTGLRFEIPEEEVDAVVIPVSRVEQPEWIIRHLKPRHVALVYTDMSKGTAKSLTESFSGSCRFRLSAADIEISREMLKDPDSPKEAKSIAIRHIRYFRETYNIPEKRIFVDTTGGKVPMSIGLFLAAEEEGCSSIYVAGGIRDKTNMVVKNPKKREDGRPIFINDRR